MSSPNKIIIGLLTLIVVILVAWFVMDYQKTERQYQTCYEKCGKNFRFGTPSQKIISCRLDCKEKYGK